MEDNSISPIINSMKRDTLSGAKHIVGSDNIPDEEALMLSHMHEKSVKKRKLNFLGIISALFLIIGISIFLVPESFFKPKDNNLTVNPKTKQIIPVDKSFAIEIPNADSLTEFRQRSLAGVVGISEILVVRDGRVVPFKDLSPFVPQRFLDSLASSSIQNYFYGLYKKDGEASVPFIILVTGDMKASEQILLDLERTMYTDLGVPLHLIQNTENETRHFETYVSVRTPFRELRDADANTLMLYGFPMDNVILFTSSRDAYNGVRARLLAGY